MQRFRGLLENHHQYVRDWKAKTGGKVIGYFCPLLPEEVAYAAGVLPIRLLAKHEPDDVSERYMYGACPPARDILTQVVKGKYDYVDGAVYTEGCQWMRHAFSSWRLHVPPSFSHYVFSPDYPEGHRAKTLLMSELGAFRKYLEEWTGKAITNEALDHAIDVYNTNRRLMKQVYELRRVDNPVISGTEAMEMVLCSQTMDKEEHNHLLNDAISQLSKRKARDPGVRLLMMGSDSHDAELERLIESFGATIVVDEFCNGSSYFWNEVIPQEDRLLGIALRYLDKPRCPLKDIGWMRRPARILDLIEDYNAEGVVVATQRFCHPHQYDNPAVFKALRERGVPFHFIERDTTLPAGETRMRVEAFIDMLRPEKVAA